MLTLEQVVKSMNDKTWIFAVIRYPLTAVLAVKPISITDNGVNCSYALRVQDKSHAVERIELRNLYETFEEATSQIIDCEILGTPECDMIYEIFDRVCPEEPKRGITPALESIITSIDVAGFVNEAWLIRILELYQRVTGNKDLEIGQWRESLAAIENVVFLDHSAAIGHDRLSPRSYKDLQALAERLEVDTDMSIGTMISNCLDAVRSRVDPKVGQRWSVLSDVCVIVDIGGLKAVNIDTGEFWDCNDFTFIEHGYRAES